MKSANKSTEKLQIKIYLLLLQGNYQIKYQQILSLCKLGIINISTF